MERSVKIDFLRSVCMLYITAIFHLTQYLGESYYLNNNVYGNSLMWSCLGTFSLLSGYLLGRKYKCDGFSDAIYFYKKRLLRFYPLFLLSTICLWLIGFNNLHQSVYGLIGLAPFVREAPRTLWYISMIMIFYLICPFVLNSNNKKRIIRCLLVFALSFIVSCFFYVDFRFIYNLLAFLIGVCVVIYEKKAINAIAKMKKKSLIVIALGLVGVYLLFFFFLNVISNTIFHMVVNIMGIVVLILIANSIKLEKWKGLIYIMGYLSMSFYLFHRFSYWICLIIYKPEGLVPLLSYLLFVSVPIGLCIAYWIQKLYDYCLTIGKTKEN